MTHALNPHLSHSKRHFQRDGFVILPHLIPEAELVPVRHAIHRLVEEHDISRHRSVFRTDDQDQGRDELFFASASTVQGFLEAAALDERGALQVPASRCLNKIGHALHDLVPEFTDLARSTWVREAFTVGGLSQTKIIQSMVIFKQPQIGGEVRWHQDASYLISQPSSVVGVWIALEDATQENGCLWMVPGAHRGPLRERYQVDWSERTGALQTIDRTPWPTMEEATAIEVPAGSVVVFHDHMPHRSFANSSARSRLAVTFHGHDLSSSWALNNWLQRPELADFII